uniref:G-patch domain-containing protein n=1 Tax=Trichobilharzia regenti TaxID=157069 RepID=A0AA85KFA7_TRIRE|nr:unnamed protein product [Trichobilharzia regenti]
MKTLSKQLFLMVLVHRSQKLMVRSSNRSSCLSLGTAIASMLKETSDAVVRSTGYTFDERTGLYYDHKSGYYYDPENQLFYEPKSGAYYKYNSETGEYTNYTASEDDSMNTKFKEFSHPVYAHLLKKIQEQHHREKKKDDCSCHSRTMSRHSRSTSSEVGHRRRRQSRSYSGSRFGRSYDKHRHESPCHYDRSVHGHSRSRRKSHKHRSGSSCSGGSCYVRKKHRKRKHSHRHRYRSSSTTGSVCSYKSRSSVRRRKHKSKRKRKSRSCRSHTSCRHTLHECKERSISPKEMVTSFSGNPVVYPPCVRLMVLASQSVQSGQLYIITSQEAKCGWGCIGRCSALCPIVNFPNDPEISEIHCEVTYDADSCRYTLVNKCPDFGTSINGVTLKKNKSTILCHGDVVRLGSTRLLVHIHNGNETCGQCDPEEIKAALAAIVDVNETRECENPNDNQSEHNESATLSTHSIKDIERRVKLNEIKKKYGLKFPRMRTQIKTDNEQYIDRAAQRRAIEANLKAAGYPLPPPPGVIRQQHVVNKCPLIARPTPASVYKPIGDENKGAQMLTKMGWTPGQGLGKSKIGIAEPITVNLRVNPQAGLGSSHSKANVVPIDSTPKELSQAYIRAKTKERFDSIP